MQNMSDYYLAKRFAVQSKQITCSPIDGKIAASVVSERIDLKNSDFKWGLNHITSDRIDELIKDFKNNALAVDDASIEKHKVASRHILYKQLADAYAFGLVCFSSIHNKDHLDEILTKYKLTSHIRPPTHYGATRYGLRRVGRRRGSCRHVCRSGWRWLGTA